MHAHRYRITVEGLLGSVSCQAFEGLNIVSNEGHTSLIADLLIIGLGLRVIVGAVTRSRQQRPEDAGTG